MDIRIKLQSEKEAAMPPAAVLRPIKAKAEPMTQVPSNSAEQTQEQRLAAIYAEINNLIGLKQVKNLIFEVQAFASIQKMRRQANLAAEPTVLHAIFRGNPGTGKTTMARLLGKLYCEMGLLSKGHLTEVERGDLVGEYIGHTAKKTREKIEEARGGVLFIDEAYALARGGEKDFGREAIDTLVKAMEDYREDLVVILAGYREEMSWFLSTNPGLSSRFPLHIDFPDYSLRELLSIAEQMYQNREYCLDIAARRTFLTVTEDALRRFPKNSGNARFVRNLVEASLRRQAVRLCAQNNAPLRKEELMAICSADLEVDIVKMMIPIKNCPDDGLSYGVS